MKTCNRKMLQRVNLGRSGVCYKAEKEADFSKEANSSGTWIKDYIRLGW